MSFIGSEMRKKLIAVTFAAGSVFAQIPATPPGAPVPAALAKAGNKIKKTKHAKKVSKTAA
ncbi:hypothetical protein [Noviherbaspirillum autotrophicum]|uniref:Uncharacterized protein n=1 Tax=Noviherbaspirillum autotrophicum TaxID=709839 RepID=A0A0C2BVM8_9BURK|nr:hypothetical protein [Noviherbaspirillum autotrophicum]KIF82081.1 hypothetical protein TSA66_16790 [Noviherbaspirillum autotrophicum]